MPIAHVDPPKIQTPKKAPVPKLNIGPPKPPTILSGLNRYEQSWNTKTKKGSMSAEAAAAFLDQLEKRAATLVPALRCLLERSNTAGSKKGSQKT